jgi:hypothetical protein
MRTAGAEVISMAQAQLRTHQFASRAMEDAAKCDHAGENKYPPPDIGNRDAMRSEKSYAARRSARAIAREVTCASDKIRMSRLRQEGGSKLRCGNAIVQG